MSDYSVQRFRGGFAIVYPHPETGKRVRERLYAPDRAGAEAEARRGWGRGDSAPWTVGRIVTAYIAAREEAGIASSQRQKDAWKAMRTFWEKSLPGLIDDRMAQDYAKQRKAAVSTIRYELNILAMALRWAAKKPERAYIPEAPTIWRPGAPERQVRHLTGSKFAKWFSCVKAPHARLYVELGVATMARPTALLQLTWPQIDWERGEINLNPPGRRQTSKRRPVIRLDAEVIEMLRIAYEARQSEYVIERGAKQIGSMKKAFQAASARSGIKATPYTLRHTGAVWAAESGIPMEVLAQYMGHEDPETTARYYARYSPGFLKGVSEAVQTKRNSAMKVHVVPSAPVL